MMNEKEWIKNMQHTITSILDWKSFNGQKNIEKAILKIIKRTKECIKKELLFTNPDPNKSFGVIETQYNKTITDHIDKCEIK